MKARGSGQMLPPPGDEKSRFVKATFDAIAPGYDLMNKVMTWGWVRTWQRQFAALTGLGPGDAALDVCCGTGELSFIMARQVGPGGRVVGLDFSSRMLAIARRKAERAGLPLEFWLEDALSLPFGDESFHCAAIGFALRNVNDLERCLREMRRVVRPGGRVISLEICRPPSRWVRAWFYPYFFGVVPFLGLGAELLHRVGRTYGSSLRPYAYLPRSLAYLPDLGELAGAMVRAGLEDVHYRVLSPGVVALHWGTRR